MTAKPVDTIVIGGGVVGLSIAYGLAREGERVRVLDEGDDAFRAARGNFGLVWVQGKGAGMPAYARWSMAAARAWPAMAQELTGLTGIDLQLFQPGGLHLCLNDNEVDVRIRTLGRLAESVGEDYRFEILDHAATKAICPSIGRDVVGASYMAVDGHVSPLRLLRALAAANVALDAEICPDQHVDTISFRNGEFRVNAGDHEHVAAKVVLAAGLGNKRLAPMVQLDAPVEPVRGQVLISERVAPFLSMPTASVRQTGDGGVQIGDSKEEVGFDNGTTIEQLSRMADRAVRSFPVLADVNLVRTWGALRIMTKDGYPIYEESTECPGAFVVTCHSGITLASQHAGSIVKWIRGGQRPEHIQNFKAGRFNV
ncbi:NAD(P)/FAD-dependent oxidoreductase [Agrobacterium vaccinii]|uniref:NAD(P)/FAD-dependent oxidoreductase n=1 Tax=Agrobacterium vaccinii TaxID=2735528 RepID=UPI001E3F95B8|nr:FAD-dependent oxidoreductase [Agrobacterium vaccinii]UHS59882.1 FAD-binding oxidoreductase [Agrobacterium vaccinii]